MMNIVHDLLELLPDTIVVTPVGTFDGFGAETPGTAKTYRAWVAGRIQQVRMADGKIIRSTVQAIVAGTGIKVTDVITLPSRFTPRQPPIIAVDKATDENGAHHDTIYF